MKLRSTTPVSKRSLRLRLISVAALFVVAAPIATINSPLRAESIDELNAKIEALKKEQAQYQSEASKLNKESDSLQAKVSSLQNQQNKIQVQVDLSQAEYDRLQKEIEQTKRDIKLNQDALGEILADMYVDGDITPLEMLASSKNIGDYIDKQAYQASISDELNGKIAKINTLKSQLENKKKDVELALINQRNARDALAASKAEQQRLLNETKGQEAAYNQLAQKSQAEQEALSARVAEMMASVVSSGNIRIVSTGSAAGYPYNCYVNEYAVSPWVDDGNYGCSQCVSYAAWKMGQVTGKYPVGWGNADMFPGNAEAAYDAGFRVTTTPRANSIAFMPAGVGGAGPVGHVAWVESVSGGSVTVSQYNYNVGTGWGKYSVVTFPSTYFSQYIYVQ